MSRPKTIPWGTTLSWGPGGCFNGTVYNPVCDYTIKWTTILIIVHSIDKKRNKENAVVRPLCSDNCLQFCGILSPTMFGQSERIFVHLRGHWKRLASVYSSLLQRWASIQSRWKMKTVDQNQFAEKHHPKLEQIVFVWMDITLQGKSILLLYYNLYGPNTLEHILPPTGSKMGHCSFIASTLWGRLLTLPDYRK